MKIKFIQDHISGLGKGSVVKVTGPHGGRLIKEKFAEEADDKEAYKRVDSKVLDPEKKRPKTVKGAPEKK